jgi:DNA-binding beta-propeller fold protein YncE
MKSASAFIAAIICATHCVAAGTAPDYTKDIAPIFAKYCNGCHNASDMESDLSLESFADLQKGGSRGAAIVPGRADASLLVRVLGSDTEPAMPPEDNPRPSDAEVALLREWIEAGAKGPDGAESKLPELSTPEIPVAANVREFVTSIAVSPDGKRLALGRYEHVDLVDPATKQVLATTPKLPGKVNRVSFAADGNRFVAACGIPGLYGMATVCNSADGAIVSQVQGHRDALYDARLSPKGDLLATCSYDRQINLWDAASAKRLRTLSGHNGAVFQLAFSADGSLLATASADDTVKIWSTATGERLDTLGQPEGSQSAVAISPDDQWVLAGGADRKLRMWRLVSREKARINPLKFSRTAHDSPIVELAFSPDGTKLVTASEGRDLRLWDGIQLMPLQDYEPQPDVVTGIAFSPGGKVFYVARMDGSWQQYEVAAVNAESIAEADVQQNADEAAAAQPVAAEAPRFDGDEQEPNNDVATANAITTNALVRGVIAKAPESGTADADLFKFQAKKGEQLVLEINAARQKSPLDSRIEVLDAQGKPVPRVLLQAVRETYFTFRGHNSTDLNDFRLHGWEYMELNEYLYSNGEVNKLWLYPRGPDSGFIVYPGISGERYAYFGSTPITHALNEPCYIVEAHPPGTKLISNGLPEYTLYYENDDDGMRRLGRDSRVLFTAPEDGEYLVRVTDIRDFGGDRYKYELAVRPPRPDFAIRLEAANLAINAGSGKEFAVVADRVDDFDGEIRVDVEGLPPGFHASSPIVIQAGQTTAYGVITADENAPAPTPENAKLAKLTASAVIAGKEVKKDGINLGELKLAEKPKVLVHVLPSKDSPQAVVSGDGSAIPEIVIAPGETVSAIVRIERNGFDADVGFGNEYSGRNLPHGVFIDNIGLNGLTLLTGESERKFFITAARGVPETSRLFHLQTGVEGGQTSWPVMLHVRNKPVGDDVNRNKVAGTTGASD